MEFGRRQWNRVHEHRVVTGLVVVKLVLWLVASLLIGMPPVVVVLLPVVVLALAAGLYRVLFAGSERDRRARGVAGVVAMVLSGVVVLGLIQLVPYGRDRSNPEITGEPAWATPETRQLMVQACYGCHSSEVEYPSYAKVAPISWAIQSHIDGGREAVNYSQWATDPGDAKDTVEVILEGEMPPGYYTRFGRHPEARLTDAEVQTLVAGLRATPGLDEGGRGEGDEDRD